MFDFVERSQSRLGRPRASAVRRNADWRFRPSLEALEDRRQLSIVWDGPASGAWENSSNWLDTATLVHRLPNAFDDVSVTPGVTVTVAATGACADFALSSSSHLIVNGNLTIHGSATADGSVSISGASARMTLSAIEPSIFDGPVSWDSGILLGGSTANYIEVNDTLTLAGSATKTLFGYLVNHGTVTHGGTGNLFLSAAAGFMNAGTYNFTDDGDFTASSTQELVNTGTLEKSGGAGISSALFRNTGGSVVVHTGTLGLQFVNETTGIPFTVDSGAVATMEQFASSATGVISGTYTGTGGGHVRFETGTLRVGTAGATFDFPDGMFEWTAGSLNTGSAALTNAGHMTFTGGGVKFFNGTLNNLDHIIHGGSGPLQIQNGTFNNTVGAFYDFVSDAGFGNAGTFANNGTVRKMGGAGVSDLQQNLVNTGVIEAQSGTFDFNDFSSTLTGGHFVAAAGAVIKPPGGTYTGTFTGSGAGVVRMEHASFTVGAAGATLNFPSGLLRWTTATIVGNDNLLTNAPTGTIFFSPPGPSSFTLFSPNFENLGTVIQDGAAVISFNLGAIHNAGVWDFQSNATLFGTGVMTNTGLLKKSAGTGTSSVSFQFNAPSENAGTIEALIGTLQFPNGMINAGGDVFVAAGATLRADAQYTQSGGTTTLDDGTLTVLSAAVGAVNSDGGLLTGIGTINANVINHADLAPGSSPGIITINGNFSQSATGVLHVELDGPAPGTGYDQLIVNGGVTLDGTLSATLGFVPALGQQFTIIDNTAADPVIGLFTGLPEGGSPDTGTTVLQISYASHSGILSDPANNVVLALNAPPAAAVTGPPVAVRGQTIAFTLSAEDAAVDEAEGFEYTVDWDDGTLQTVPKAPGNGAGLEVEHSYVVVDIYKVRVTAMDQHGAVSEVAEFDIDVRAAALFDDSLAPGQDMLVVGGTPGRDKIRLYPGPAAGDVSVKVNGTFVGNFRPTTRLVVHGYGNKDVLVVDRRLTLPAWLYGGPGQDELTGGGPNVLIGGAGNDRLTGYRRRDLLFGGAGVDHLFGGAGDDLLIADTTDFEADGFALAAIQAEWLSSRSKMSRFRNITGDAANPEFAARLNGTTFLRAKGASRTLSRDANADILRGEAGWDVFFANLVGGVLDTIFDRATGERAVDLV